MVNFVFRQVRMILVVSVVALTISCNKSDEQDNNNPPADTTRLPVVVTAAVSSIGITTATGGGEVTSDGGSAVTARGVCWSSVTGNPSLNDHITLDSSGKGPYTSLLSGLPESSHIWVVAYATNSKGTSYGNPVMFNTRGSQGTMLDIEGTIYPTIRIGHQVWTAKNLHSKHYSNGDPIEHVTDPSAWLNKVTGAYCFYNMEPVNEGTYGVLYNWHAINDPRGVAPSGWHVPTEAEFDTLISFLGNDVVAGGKLKEPGTGHWHSPNAGATNESGFTALPGGSSGFNDLGYQGIWWTATPFNQDNCVAFYVGYNSGGSSKGSFDKTSGFSVRLVKN
jgi:uncharacterized protein (TIGR02145 family)